MGQKHKGHLFVFLSFFFPFFISLLLNEEQLRNGSFCVPAVYQNNIKQCNRTELITGLYLNIGHEHLLSQHAHCRTASSRIGGLMFGRGRLQYLSGKQLDRLTFPNLSLSVLENDTSNGPRPRPVICSLNFPPYNSRIIPYTISRNRIVKDIYLR